MKPNQPNQTILRDLMHSWKLPEQTIAQCSRFGIRKIPIEFVVSNLDANAGMLAIDGDLFVPVYKGYTRPDLRVICEYEPSHPVWINFRKIQDLAIVIIQPDRTENS